MNFSAFCDKLPETAAHFVHVVFFFQDLFFFNLYSVLHCCHGGMLLEKYIGNSNVCVGFTDVPGETMLICVVHQN
jgi:hypothetical protein